MTARTVDVARSSAGLEVSVRVAGRGLDVELCVAPGEVLAVLGPNGAGKSTVLDVVAGLVVPDDGFVRLGGQVLTDVEAGVVVPPHRRGISLLAQDPLLFPHLTAAANVAFGPRSRNGRTRAAAVASEWLRAVDAAGLADRRPGELSGGQAQRVALARALAVEPRVLLLDEPMAALDVTAAPAMRTLLRRVLREQRNTPSPSTILVTHDLVDALTLADRVVVLEAGRVVEQGPVADVLSRPRSAFAARIAGANLLLGTAVEADSSAAPHGEPDHAASEHAGPVLVSTDHPPTQAVRCGTDLVHGRGTDDWHPGLPAAAVFSPSAVAVYRDPPIGSPRNVFRARIAELTDRGGIIRVQAEERTDGSPGLSADLTPAAAAELGLAPGLEVYFAIKATEVRVYAR
ncbi:sulfate/molybdate ABC transporter ATP-binding protein [Nocardia blacklockiae]|uniref:sulfate/molybdate ABC transporter ATP-binding protein n=1 Tax=Nocardia blacklockiae TaxID=480036 RepID=UPI001893D848|nr:ATP-binding cassette domain-containing protein [Nocardia blacklockiae]MBF6176093.1 ATP-binding cassette domain-containing protein [Nocardia blacklockiae]